MLRCDFSYGLFSVQSTICIIAKSNLLLQELSTLVFQKIHFFPNRYALLRGQSSHSWGHVMIRIVIFLYQ
jgi:hypothetical protein